MAAVRKPSSIIGGVAKDFASAGLANACVVLVKYHNPEMPLEVAGAYVVLGTVALGIARRGIEEALARRGIEVVEPEPEEEAKP
jgi:predicted histidine transporter YuiF (NhaC family)